jgi:chromosome segregation ATPase
MSTTIDTFIYLKRDIEQSFQRVQTITTSSHYNPQELDQLLNHISCTLDDLEKINQLLRSSSTHPLDLSENEDDFEDTTKLVSKKHQKDQNEKSFLSSYSSDEREEFVRHMKTQLDYYKTKVQSTKKDAPMEIIRLDQPLEEETEDQMICKQDAQLNDFHLSIVSLKNLTQNINAEINDHIQVLDNLETNMVNSQNRVENLTKRTKNFIRISTGGVGGHTCLFCIAVGLFFLIVILIVFF